MGVNGSVKEKRKARKKKILFYGLSCATKGHTWFTYEGLLTQPFVASLTLIGTRVLAMARVFDGAASDDTHTRAGPLFFQHLVPSAHVRATAGL
jgi:hypothetical protein